MVLTQLTPTENMERSAINPQDTLTPSAAIAVNNATITEKILILTRNYKDTLIHIINSHASKSLDYNLYGHNNYNAGVQPTFNSNWVKLFSSDKTITFGNAGAETITDPWQWIIIAFKETDGANASEATVYVTGSK
jgi:hypothetical protein